MSTRIKIVLIGDSAVGKTSYMLRFKTGEFVKKYDPTIGVEVYTITFTTSHGTVICDVWDTAGQEKYGALGSGYYHNADAAICMFDVGAKITFKNIPQWVRKFRNMCPNAPIVIVGNKVDILDRKIMPSKISKCIRIANMNSANEQKSLDYVDMSVRSCYNYEKPFLKVLRKHFYEPNLEIIN